MAVIDCIPAETRDRSRTVLAGLTRSTLELGRQLYAMGRLSSLKVSRGAVRASVTSARGARSFEVRGDPSDLRCGCPFGARCKHTAVVLLALSSAPTLPSAPLRPRARLVFSLKKTGRGVAIAPARQRPAATRWARPELLSPLELRDARRVGQLDGGELLDLLQLADDGVMWPSGRLGALVVRELLLANVLFFDGDPRPLRRGWPRRSKATLSPDEVLIPTSPAYYVNAVTGAVGVIEQGPRCGDPDLHLRTARGV